jgi:long-chain acyl-CoA synthetase
VAGTHRGRFTERNLDLSQDFRNPYERTKFEAETLVLKRSRSLPVQVLRPSIVVGDSRTGWTPSFNVLYWPLRAFARGAYPAIPAKRSAPADVVPVDYVADAVLGLAGRPGTTYHLTAGGRTSSVGEVIDLAADYLRRPSPRVISPAVYRRTVHPLLLRSATEARRRALNHSEAFFPYFATKATYDTARSRAALDPCGIIPAPLSAYFDRLVDYAQLADWGRSPLTRAEMHAHHGSHGSVTVPT